MTTAKAETRNERPSSPHFDLSSLSVFWLQLKPGRKIRKISRRLACFRSYIKPEKSLCFFYTSDKESLSDSASLADLVQTSNLCRAHIYHGSAELAERPASLQACIHTGESAQGVVQLPSCFKIIDLRQCQIVRHGAALPCAARNV